jgi:outer membrane receptor for ferric coprogen and ferric-rhodotorulic acid
MTTPNFRYAVATLATIAALGHAGQSRAESPEEKLKSPAAEDLGSAATLPELVVTASTPSNLPERQQSGWRLEIAPRDPVQTVNVVTRREIKDRGVTSVHQALETVVGLRPVSGVYSSTEVTAGIRSRGFENNNTYINGARGSDRSVAAHDSNFCDEGGFSK